MPDDSFAEFVLDQLSGLPNVRMRAMFGAYALFCGEKIFGIIDEGRLFFKTDAQSQEDYTSRGMEPFTYKAKGKTVTMSYHEVPPEVLDNPREMVMWAARAMKAVKDKTAKPKK